MQHISDKDFVNTRKVANAPGLAWDKHYDSVVKW
jgi:hypothetical protein